LGVRQLRLVGFRALATQTLAFSPGLNLLFGDNASGKTSLLEALDIASRGRSFRTQHLSEIARWDGNGEWALDVAHAHAVGDDLLKLRYRGGALESRQQSEVLSREQMARSLPALILGPDLHRLMDDGPKIRRAFMDWALFHVEHTFAEHWRRYQQALRQRNAAIRRQAPRPQIFAWNDSLLSAGTVITQHRRQLVEGLRVHFAATVSTTEMLPAAEIYYRQGWAKDLSFEAALNKADAHIGAQSATPVGPHRGDLELLAGSARVQTTLSRGQQKVFLISLALALANLVHERVGRWPLLAIDDWHAELSDNTAASILDKLRTYQGQRILSSFAAPTTAVAEARLFHVEQGRFSEC
tara:strand:- start:3850 stop:4914 length:1065 start_codon:yes stop_codon:yes gene_type:complete